MDKIAFYDTKTYDRKWFTALSENTGVEICFLEMRLNADTAPLAAGCRIVCAFVNDDLSQKTLTVLKNNGVSAVVMRCAGYNNVDVKAAENLGIRVYRVPSYSPTSVAEHAMALLLSLARKTHRAFVRTRERNFSLEGLEGIDLKGRTCGVVGTGKVGYELCNMCRGFGMKVVAYDLYPRWESGIEYTDLDELFKRSDVISLHCPLTPETYHMVDSHAIELMKPGVYIINTSRGPLIDSSALLEGIKSGKIGAAGLDVYEEEAEVFYEDVSLEVMEDDVLNLLLSQPNVLVTSHQAFLTDEALEAIARTTLQNVRCFLLGEETDRELTKTAVNV